MSETRLYPWKVEVKDEKNIKAIETEYTIGFVHHFPNFAKEDIENIDRTLKTVRTFRRSCSVR
jgi:hypothetical protein